ncbi:MAG: Tad domain-containing protein [Candidatus Paceibacterota bacterium]
MTSRLFHLKPKGYSVFFLSVMIPSIFFGAALMVDASRVILAKYQISNLADNVSMAAATGIDESNSSLDTRSNGLVVSRGREMFDVSIKHGVVKSDLKPTLEFTELSPSRVTIRIRFIVEDLLLFGYFGQDRFIAGSSTRSAGICLSGSDALSCSYNI